MKSLETLESSWRASALPVTTSSQAVLIAEARRRQGEVLAHLLSEGVRGVLRLSGLSALAAALMRYADYRRTVAELERLDPRVLRDIGMSRSEIHRVALACCEGGRERDEESEPSAPARVMAALRRWKTYRRVYAELAVLDDRVLRDVGLFRDDIERVARASAYGDNDAARPAVHRPRPVVAGPVEADETPREPAEGVDYAKAA